MAGSRVWMVVVVVLLGCNGRSHANGMQRQIHALNIQSHIPQYCKALLTGYPTLLAL